MEIKEKILEIFNELYGKSEHRHFSYCLYPLEDCTCRHITKIKDDTSIINSGYLDSMSLLTLITEIETEFSIKINHGDIFPGNFDTINKIENIIKKHI